MNRSHRILEQLDEGMTPTLKEGDKLTGFFKGAKGKWGKPAEYTIEHVVSKKQLILSHSNSSVGIAYSEDDAYRGDLVISKVNGEVVGSESTPKSSDTKQSPSGWSLIKEKDTISMYRLKGKTFPSITYNKREKTIYARDDNGSSPSDTISTKDITLKGVQELLNSGISNPHPPADMLKEFISLAK